MRTAFSTTSLWTSVLLGGGLAAALDISYAILRYNPSNPLSVLHSVASGWLGRDAFQSGWTGGAIGLLFHFTILFIAAALYYAASRRWKFLRDKWWICGLAFGIAIYLFMNFVVLPLSAYPRSPTYPLPVLMEGFAVHAFLVGLPIAWAMRK